ncbi:MULTISPECIES: hypothetical protein [unclassified Psychrobacter]|uniref:hypothetical protein n=1 Tax=unclassified Psychrobacter TaxID=196806 RepID=UPI00178799A2|nr:hypothetical protein [Psychrobacter sp. FME13]MBE0443436.1 hypothetical protein [Psychrobacter sp. FME13]
MKIKYLLIPIVIAFLSSCSYNSDITEPKKVSIIEYIDKSDLERYGFTTKDIKDFDSKIKNSDIFSDNYTKYETKGFTILSNDENPEHIFILKNNKFIASFDDKARTLYSKEANIPTRLDALVTYIPTTPSLSYNNGKSSYDDLNLDGVDIIYEVMPSNDKRLDYFSAEILGTPNLNIIDAKISGKECKALVGYYACCFSDEGNYEAYKFDYKAGWSSIPSNKILNEACNSENFEAAKNELKSKLFSN